LIKEFSLSDFLRIGTLYLKVNLGLPIENEKVNTKSYG